MCIYTQVQTYFTKLGGKAGAGAGLLLLLFVSGGVGCDKGEQAPKPQRLPPQVVVRKPVQRDLPLWVRAPVDLKPLLSAEVVSKQLGYLSTVLVERGDVVRRGQLLALVRPSELPDQLAVARGALQQAQAQLQQAKENRSRTGSLAPSGVVSQLELQQSSTALSAAEAAEAGARANLSALATRLGETRLESPLDGVVTQRRLDPGALVGPQTGALLSVARIDTLRVFIGVRERDAKEVAVGQTTEVQVDALPGQTFQGRVVRLAPAFDPLTRTLEVEVHLDNSAGKLRPGMYGRAAIKTSVHPQALVVPEGAIQLSNDKAFVFVVREGKTQRLRVQLGIDDGEWLEVKQGLAPADEVIVAGIDGLSDGMPVRTVAQVDVYTGAKAAPAGAAADVHAPSADKK